MYYNYRRREEALYLGITMSNTPLTDREEKFIVHEARNISGVGYVSRREGYVSSTFARKLELRIQELESQLPTKESE
tara:strand:- start:2563 stop:2793 length:231 start_codon:yes stop_codon:yes gene_type:complete